MVVKKRPDPQRMKGEPNMCICTYCGQWKPISKDHVPPRTIYGDTPPPNLLTVPSCRICNEGFGKDDEYFRIIVSLTLDAVEAPELQQVIDKTLRTFARPESHRLTSSVLRTLKQLEMTTPSGLYYGKSLGFDVNLTRIRSTCNRIIRGLYFTELGRRLPTGTFVHSEVVKPLTDLKMIKVVGEHLSKVMSRPFKTVGKNFFAYAWQASTDNDEASIWALKFYNHLVVFGMTVPEEFDSIRMLPKN